MDEDVPQTLYKVTGPEGEPLHGGRGNWPLPKIDANGRRHRGAWRTIPADEDLVACRVGFHIVSVGNLHLWLKDDCVVWEVEYQGELIDHEDKFVARKVRLVRRVAGVTKTPTRRWDSAGYGLNGQALLDFLVSFESVHTTKKLVFGVHRIDAREAEDAPAWPSYGKLKRRSDAKWKRFLKQAS